MDLIIRPGKVSNREQEHGENAFFFFLSGVQTRVDAITQGLLVPTRSQLSVTQEREINRAPEM